MTEFVELHTASAFSFLQAASQPDALIERAVAVEMPSVALLDHNGVYGAARFHTSAKRNGVRAHIGAEISVNTLGPRLRPPAWLPHRHKPEPARLPLLCESRLGYQNLCQIVTRFKMREATKGPGAATEDDLTEYAAGLVCLTGGDEGPLAAALARGGESEGRAVVERLTRIFGAGSVFVELQRHQDRAEEARNQAAIRIARSLGLPVLATDGVRHATEYDREILDLFTAIRNGVELNQAGRLLCANSARHLRPAREMAALFRDVPGAIAATVDLSARLRFKLDDLGYEFPRYSVPDGETMDSFLAKRVAEGVELRFGPKRNRSLYEKAKKQVTHELSLIARLRFAGYFLIVWDIVRYCKRNGILVQGRGSAANSAVCYCLEITAVDPVEMELLFERFLSESRNEWPDIDLDLPSEDKREQAIQYVYQRYGELGAAMTANVITYRGKSAARETGIVEIIEPYHGRIFDPACGSGGMFVQSAAFVEHHRQSVNEISVYGQEKVAETIRLCKMNLAVHGLSGDIRQSVTYYEDPHKSVGKFDFVMANPPFNVDKVDKERIKDDPRYHFVSDLRTASCVSCFVAAFLSNETVEGRRSGTVAWSCIGAGSERQECGIFLS